jgi:hypothetical protein
VQTVRLDSLLGEAGRKAKERLALFALLNLGIVESLRSGLLTASDALRLFFHADNCLFVRRKLRDKTADRIMSHGVQLPDLFDVLPSEEAQREFQRELAAMQGMCFQLLEGRRKVA